MEYPEKKKVLILLGPPGSGKGSQAHLLKEALCLPHVSTGDLLRENIKLRTPIGCIAKDYIEKGMLFPDLLLLEMLTKRLAHPDCVQGYILDGVPRTLAQAKAIDVYLSNETHLDLSVVNLEVADAILIERITYRRLCLKCQAPYHLLFAPPRIEGSCDHCSGTLFQREDDSLPIIQTRLGVYHSQTAPLIDYYQALGLLSSVDGSLSKEEVLDQILQIVSTTS